MMTARWCLIRYPHLPNSSISSLRFLGFRTRLTTATPIYQYDHDHSSKNDLQRVLSHPRKGETQSFAQRRWLHTVADVG